MKKGVGCISQRYGSGDLDPDPHQNVTDPQHCFEARLQNRVLTRGQIKERVSQRFSTFGFFHESVSPKPLSIPLGPFQIFFENSRRYSQLKVHHRCR
jgi:hypothetical protein